MHVGFKTDKGILRSSNEDACFVLLHDKVYILADGVGGGNSGEIASRTAVSEIANYVVKHPLSHLLDKYEIVGYMRDAFEAANTKIYDMARAHEENFGMATTAIIVYVNKGKAYIGNIGDSRVYLYRNGDYLQLTEDHTYVNTLVKAGILSREEADQDERKNVIIKALGAEPTVEPDFFQVEVKKGDILLACSDGLYDEVSDEEIVEIIKEKDNMNELAAELDRLIEAGYTQFVVNNIAHIQFLKGKNVKMIAGPYLYTFNRWAVSWLENQDVGAFIMPYENSRRNLEATWEQNVRARVLVPVFAYPALFRMRFKLPADYDFTYFEDKEASVFKVNSTVDGSFVMPEEPFAITDKTDFITSSGFKRLLVDFSKTKVSRSQIKAITTSMVKGQPLPGVSRFNWKDGFYSPQQMEEYRLSNERAAERKAAAARGGKGARSGKPGGKRR